MKVYAMDLRALPTLCVGQCCSLKIEDSRERVWLCRVNGGVTVERLDGRGWVVVSGGCSSPVADAYKRTVSQ